MTNNPAFWTALEQLINDSERVIDRPRGTAHPKFPHLIYPLDYGYLKDSRSMDGEGIDLWQGSGKQGLDAIICTVDLMKRDSEIKLLLNCTEEEKERILHFHNESEYMKGLLVRR